MSKKDLIARYIEGWKKKDIFEILNILTEDCEIIESHGSTYNGKKMILSWIEEWIKNGRVDKWEMNSYYEIGDVAFFEWMFECTFEEKRHSFEGLSLIKFEKDKISFIREYRTTKPRFDWKR